MDKNSIFNMTVCIFGVLILLIHIVNLIVKKNKRKDEKCLLDFFVFTVFHFATYLTFTFVKLVYTSNAFIISFYTIFYLMNNIELFLLVKYMNSYVGFSDKTAKALKIVNYSLFAVFCLLDIINIFIGIFFTAVDGVYIRSSTMIISQIYQFIMFVVVFCLAVFNKKLKHREKLAFALYCTLPFVAIILQNIFKGYAIAYASIIIAIEILFALLTVEKNLEISKQKEKAKEAQIKIMLSQIQPHFIYNALSGISTLIEIDPQKAQTALDDFTNYLRSNLSSLTETKLIPFEEELKHIKTYIALEKMRFGDRINVVYDLETTDFYLPALTIQPIVENAIKHGILKKAIGGTITIKTYQKNNAVAIEISDDGVGFDVKNVYVDEKEHFGLNNIKYRINNMCKGNITINSEIGKGTNVVVTFEK